MKRNKKNKPEFDERQKAVRAKADKAAVFCFGILLFACFMFDVIIYDGEFAKSFSVTPSWYAIRSAVCLFLPLNIKSIIQILGDADSFATNYVSSPSLGGLICYLVVMALYTAPAILNLHNDHNTIYIILIAACADSSFVFILRFVKGEINERKTREDYIETKNKFDE